MKKAIGIIFILLANIIMLAHAAIPHHHHDFIPVAVVTDIHNHNSDNHDHNHAVPVEEDNHHSTQHSEGLEDCLLTQSYLKTNIINQIGQTIFIQYLPWLVPEFCNDFQIKYTDYGNLPFRQQPYFVPSYDHYIAQSLGLRAPPFC